VKKAAEEVRAAKQNTDSINKVRSAYYDSDNAQDTLLGCGFLEK